MEEKKEHETEGKILCAARKVFHQRGYFGTRMQEIADAAGINKALLHYYFRSKDTIFGKVLDEAFSKIFSKFSNILISDVSIEIKITKFVDEYIDLLIENPYLPGFLLHEINHNPEKLAEFFHEKLESKPNKIILQFKEALENSDFPDIDPRHILVNILAMCIFPFAAKPILKYNLNFSEDEYILFLKDRKKLIPMFVLNSIRKP
jgi:TetR/AcrR family transcriptional regulator